MFIHIWYGYRSWRMTNTGRWKLDIEDKRCFCLFNEFTQNILHQFTTYPSTWCTYIIETLSVFIMPYTLGLPRGILPHQTRDGEPMLAQCWASVEDAGPTLSQHWFNVADETRSWWYDDIISTSLFEIQYVHWLWFQANPHILAVHIPYLIYSEK